MNCLDKIKDTLLTVTQDVYHYKALKKKDRYIVWAEDGSGNQLNANNARRQTTVTGRVNLFSKTENDEYIRKIEEAMIREKISFKLDSVQYEEETGYIHHIWDFEVS